MSVLRDVQRLLTIIEGQYPRSKHSALYRIAAKRALRSAALAETEWRDGDTMGATREGSLEEEECQDPGNQEVSTTGSTDMLTALLRRQLPATSPSSKAKQKIVQLSRSSPSRPTSGTSD